MILLAATRSAYKYPVCHIARRFHLLPREVSNNEGPTLILLCDRIEEIFLRQNSPA